MGTRFRWIAPRLCTAVLLGLFAAFPTTAQQEPTVEAAFLAYADATKTYDAQRMTELMHPEALSRFRSAIDAALRGPKKDLAEKELLPLFAATTPEEFAALSDFEAYKRLNDTIAKNAPEVVRMMSDASFVIVGVTLKDDVAHVTYELVFKVEGHELKPQVVQTLKQHEGKWLLLLPSTAEGTLAGFKVRYE